MMSILQFIWVGDLDESKPQRLQNPQALSYERCHPKKMIVRQDKKETRIGRKNSKMPPDYALESAVSNRMISRNHVTIERLSKGNYMLYDHSLNGTYVNFVRVIGGTILKHEDIVCFGHINGANIKPGESVTPFATDLKYRVEIIDKSSGSNAPNDNKSQKKHPDPYSHSESSQYEDTNTESTKPAQQQKKSKHKPPTNEKPKKPPLLVKRESDDESDRSSDSSGAARNTAKKPKKPSAATADLSSLSSSDDDDVTVNDRLKKDPRQFSKKPSLTSTSADKSKKYRGDLSSSRKRKLTSSMEHNHNNSMKTIKKSHNSSSKRPLQDERRPFSSSGAVASGQKDHRKSMISASHPHHQKQSSKMSTATAKYSSADNGNGPVGKSSAGSKRNSSSGNANNQSASSAAANYDYEECSAHPCLRPDGENLIDWIMCDKCTQWFHQSCVGLDEAVEDDESYYCPYCAR